MIKYSIVVPTKKRILDIKRLLKSINNQIYLQKDYEVIIVNDGSHYDIDFSEYKAIPSINYIELNKSFGPARARNVGVKHSRGEIICFIDDDCVVEKNYLSNLSEIYSGNNQLVCVGGAVKTQEITHINIINEYLKYIHFLDGPLYRNGKIINMATANLTLKKMVFYEIGQFKEEFKHSEDENLMWRMSNKYKLSFSEKIVVFHNNDISFKSFFKKYKGYGKGVYQQRIFANEELSTDLTYPVYCLSYIHLLSRFHLLIKNSNNRWKNNLDKTMYSKRQLYMFKVLSLVQEVSFQLGALSVMKTIK